MHVYTKIVSSADDADDLAICGIYSVENTQAHRALSILRGTDNNQRLKCLYSGAPGCVKIPGEIGAYHANSDRQNAQRMPRSQ